jgi:CBS domain-containing protein
MPAKRPTTLKSKASSRAATKKTGQKHKPAAASRAARSAARPAPSTTVSARPDAGASRAGRAGAGRSAGGAGDRAQRWALVTARDLMRTNVVTVAYSAPLSEVERVLADHRILGAPVVDAAGRIIGVVSVSDLMERYAEDPDAKPRRGQGWFRLSTEELADEDLESFEVPAEAEETARDIMTAQVFTVPASAGLREIANAMSKQKVHRVLVEDGGKLVGLISTLDILEALGA